MNIELTATIVTYRNDPPVLSNTINSFLSTDLSVKLYLVDNSPNEELKGLCDDSRVEYINTGANIGFGSGHNVILKQKEKLGKYHLILNPDIIIKKGTLEALVDYLSKNEAVGAVMPKILNTDDTVQFLPKLFPHPLNLLLRFMPWQSRRAKAIDDRYMLSNVSKTEPYDIGIVSGCFMLVRSEVFSEMRFDERFFMYFEDFDLSRRIGRHYELKMCPQVSVYHDYERGSHKSFFLFKTMLISMIKYFNKYGWLFDSERRLKNKELYNRVK